MLGDQMCAERAAQNAVYSQTPGLVLEYEYGRCVVFCETHWVRRCSRLSAKTQRGCADVAIGNDANRVKG